MVVARQEQIQTLKKLIHSSESSFLISGISNTGKSTATRSTLKELVDPQNISWVDCVECLTMKILFERILRHWNANRSRSITNMEDFISEVKLLSSLSRRFLILDHCEELMELDPTVIHVFLKLSELTQMNICVVFITAQKWDDMLSRAPAYPPIQVDFPNYTEKEIVQVMMLDIPKDECPSFYEGYVTTIAQTFRSSCKDVGELRYLATLLFPNYIEPIKKGLIKKEESAKLYYSFSKDTLRKQLDTLYLRDVSFSEWNLCGGKLDVSTTSAVKQVELPYFTRFLMIASFLASYNPSKYDSRFFSKGGEGRAKVGKKGGANNGSLMRSQLVGPKVFTVARMLIIFYSILPDQDHRFTFDIHCQIRTLISLRLLTRTSNVSRLDSIKCKCNVSYVFIKSVARSVHFDIGKYLYDFIDI